VKRLKHYTLIFLIVFLSVSTVTAFHVPPWDTGHNSFMGDDGDDTDPGDDGPCKTGSPVELVNGNFIYSTRDLLITGLGQPIEVARTYNSSDMRKGPFGNGWVFSYDQRLIETTDGMQVYAICSQSNGKRERFVKNAGGTYTAPPHVHATLVKNSDNSHTLRENTGFTRRFDAEGKLISSVDRNGNALTLAYDSTGFPISITDASGRIVSLTKGPDGKVESITDPANRIFRYTYDSVGNLMRSTDPLGNSTTYQYDSKSNLIALTDARGNTVMRLSYDNSGRVTTHVEAGETWTYTYQPTQHRTTKRDSQGNTWIYDYNDTGNITKRTDPFGSTELYKFDSNLNITEFTDKNGNKTTYTYDAIGNLLSVTDPTGSTQTMTYEPTFNQLLSIRDSLGHLTQFDYDSHGNLIERINALGQVTRFDYDSHGQVVRATDPAGNSATFAYDVHGNLSQSTDPLGNSSSATFDLLGKVLGMTDGEARVTQFFYDGNERLVRIINAAGGATNYTYDEANNLTALTLPSNARTTFEYDNFNRLSRRTNPLSQSTSYSYDRRGNLTSVIYPNGKQVTYTYDKLDRVVSKVKAGDTVTYTYDRIGNRLTITDADSKLTFKYDSLNHVVETNTGSASNQPSTTIRYTFDANGNRRTMTDPAGGITNYDYDDLSLLSSITDPSGLKASYAYDSTSRRKSMTMSNGMSTSYTYDAARRLSSMVSQSGAGSLVFNYTYDRVGNRLNLTKSAGTDTYNYDSLNRLISATHSDSGNPAETFSLDVVGNRVTSHLSATHSHDAANRLLADAQFDYIYDQNGNLIKKTERATALSTNYSYDVENQLTQIVSPSGTTSYRYDGIGRRIEKNVNGQITRFVYDGLDVLFEYDATTVQARFTHGQSTDDVLSVQRGGTTHFFEKDSLGSVIRTIDNTGAVSSSYVYDSFGRLINQTGASVASYRFQGRELDQESGLYYYRARYYDPTAGRFLTEDPVDFLGGENFYEFVLSNPINRLDPLGLWAGIDDLIFAGGGALGGLLGQGVSDLFSGELSGWEDYVGSAIGGAATGEALLYTGPIAAGAIGGAATNLSKQGLKNLTGKQCGFDGKSLLFDTGIGGATGLIPGVRAAGVTTGRNSYNAIYKQMSTKFANGTISNVSAKTAGKMFVGRSVDKALLPGFGAAGAVDAINRRRNSSGGGECSCQK
jgi:RHS repeat-associated protein